MCAGTFFAFASVAIPLLKKTADGDSGISSSEGSWIGKLKLLDRKFIHERSSFPCFLTVSLFYIGTILGSLIGGTMNDRFGAKKVCLIMAPTVIFNWTLTAISTDLHTLLVSRVISGMCYGIFLALGKNLDVNY